MSVSTRDIALNGRCEYLVGMQTGFMAQQVGSLQVLMFEREHSVSGGK